MTPLLAIEGLTVDYRTPAGALRAVNTVSLQVQSGETLALVGESGSGKSTIALALLDLLRTENATVSGRLRFQGRDIAALGAAERRALGGRHIGIVFQDPFTSLNPGLAIGRQVAEPLVEHLGLSAAAAGERAIAALAEVGLPDPASLARAFPHQLSGGMQQRVLIATALICGPELLVLDEPTTALDVTVEAQILDLLERLRRERRLAMIYITHNLGVVSRIADRVCVLYAGHVFELGERSAVLGAPMHPYTKGLLAALPQLAAPERAARLSAIAGEFPDLTAAQPGCVFASRCPFAEERCRSEPQLLVEHAGGRGLRCWKASELVARPWPATPAPAPRQRVASSANRLEARDLAKTYGAGGWLPWRKRRSVRAVDGVSLTIAAGEVLGLVGESGSGKTTLGRLIVRLIEPTRGRLLFGDEDMTASPPSRRFRKLAQLVFQNPDSSLNPRRSIGEAIARAVELHGNLDAAARRSRVDSLLDRVGLPRRYYGRYPHQLSGGEKQRAGIARALATGPDFIVCDEPVSALDVSVQATILNLLKDLRDELGVAYLFISHDLSVVAHVADRIAVMYAGRICEEGPADAVLGPPYHPYTEALLSAVPLVDAAARSRIVLKGEPASASRPAGCVFANRCPRKLGAICDDETPPVREPAAGHRILCHIPLADLEQVAAVIPAAAVSSVAQEGRQQ